MDRICDRRVMRYYHDLRRPEHAERPLQLHGFIERGLHECLDLSFTERSENAAAKAAQKALRPGEANSVALVAAAVQHLDPFRGHHLDEFLLLAAFVVVVAEHRNYGNSQPYKSVQQGSHLLRLAVIG